MTGRPPPCTTAAIVGSGVGWGMYVGDGAALLAVARAQPAVVTTASIRAPLSLR